MKKIIVILAVLAGLLAGCGDGGNSGSSSGGGPSPPTVLTGNYESAPSSSTGIAHGNVTSDGGVPPVFERGICWGVTPNPSKETGTCESTSAGTGEFSEVLIGVLNDNTVTNYMRAYAVNAIGISWGYSKLITLKTH